MPSRRRQQPLGAADLEGERSEEDGDEGGQEVERRAHPHRRERRAALPGLLLGARQLLFDRLPA